MEMIFKFKISNKNIYFKFSKKEGFYIFEDQPIFLFKSFIYFLLDFHKTYIKYDDVSLYSIKNEEENYFQIYDLKNNKINLKIQNNKISGHFQTAYLEELNNYFELNNYYYTFGSYDLLLSPIFQ